MSKKQPRLQIVSRGPASGVQRQGRARQGEPEARKVSGRWLLSALALTISAAALCAWCTLCLLFWQGSWQLLYHPSAAVTRTPANVGLAFDSVAFEVSDAGLPQIKGWWIPAEAGAPYRRFTVVDLHGRQGNLSDTVDALAQLHAVGLNVLAFDYCGYGQSRFVRPSEAHWLEDAGSALQYLTATRHIDPSAIVLDGEGLGANLALEVAAAHSELAGVVLESPAQAPMNAIFLDPRAKLVPAHLLVRDRYDLDAAAAEVRVPVLWFAREGAAKQPEAYSRIEARKMLVWLGPQATSGKQFQDAMRRWLDQLPNS